MKALSSKYQYLSDLFEKNELRLGSMATLSAKSDSGAATLVMYSRTSAEATIDDALPLMGVSSTRPWRPSAHGRWSKVMQLTIWTCNVFDVS